MRSNILKISELGLVEMTRKRTRSNLMHLLTEPCPACDGKGRIKSIATISCDIMRRIRQVACASPESTRLVVRASPGVATFLCEEDSTAMDRLEREIGCRITVEPLDTTDHTRFEVRSV